MIKQDKIQDITSMQTDLMSGVNAGEEGDDANKVNGRSAPRIVMNDLNHEAFLK